MFVANTLADRDQPLDWRGNGDGTPLRSLPGLAARLAIAALHVKDEGKRLGLGAFKALGGGYAVARLVLDEASLRLGRPLDYADLDDEAVRKVAAGLTFACATDGNHGRAVAEGARRVGAAAVIFVHAHVSDARVAAIAAYGARIVRVEGGYDDSVREAARVAAAEGWTIVSDTSWPGYERIPALVMQGYTVMADEALSRLPEPPTHVFVQVGVGGVAAAVAAHLSVRFGRARPVFIAVDPERAACMAHSLLAGHPVAAPVGAPTVMAMLDCYEPSPLAFGLLARTADGVLTVTDEAAVAAMRALARPEPGDPAIVAGESGAAGLAGLMSAAADPGLRAAIGLEASSRVLLFVTEGATDPQRYAQHVGMRPDAVGA